MLEASDVEDPRLWYGTIAAKAIEITQRDTRLSMDQIAECIPCGKPTLYRYRRGLCPNVVTCEGLCVALARVRDVWNTLKVHA